MLYGILVVSTKKDQQTQNTTQSGFFLRKANSEVFKEAPISSRRIESEFTLEEKDTNFVTFRNYVDDLIKTAVISIYGDLSQFTE